MGEFVWVVVTQVGPFGKIHPPGSLVRRITSHPCSILGSRRTHRRTGKGRGSLCRVVGPRVSFPIKASRRSPTICLGTTTGFQVFRRGN